MKNNDMKFEQALTKLEEIVRQLESGSLGLDQALEQYEEGIGLLRFCTSQLEQARARITVLTKDKTGNITESEFDD